MEINNIEEVLYLYKTGGYFCRGVKSPNNMLFLKTLKVKYIPLSFLFPLVRYSETSKRVDAQKVRFTQLFFFIPLIFTTASCRSALGVCE